MKRQLARFTKAISAHGDFHLADKGLVGKGVWVDADSVAFKTVWNERKQEAIASWWIQLMTGEWFPLDMLELLAADQFAPAEAETDSGDGT